MRLAEKALINDIKRGKKVDPIKVYIASTLEEKLSKSDKNDILKRSELVGKQLDYVDKKYSELEEFGNYFLKNKKTILKNQPSESLTTNSLIKMGIEKDKNKFSALTTHQYLWSLKKQEILFPISNNKKSNLRELALMYDFLMNKQNINHSYFENSKLELFDSIGHHFDITIMDSDSFKPKVISKDKSIIKNKDFLLFHFYTDKGHKLFKEKKYNSAIDNFDAALAFDNYNPEMYFNMGVCKQMLKDNLSALRCHNKAIEFDEGNKNLKPHYFYAKGEILKRMNKLVDSNRKGEENAWDSFGKAVKHFEERVGSINYILNDVRVELLRTPEGEVRDSLEEQRLSLISQKSVALKYLANSQKQKNIVWDRYKKRDR